MLFLLFFFVGVGGFKGQVRWPLFFSFVFLSFSLVEKPVFLLKKGILFIFLCLPLFLFSLLWASTSFTFSLFIFLFFLSFFLPSCLSCQYLVLAFCFCFVCFLFQDVLRFFLVVVAFCFVAFLFCLFLLLATYQKHLPQNWILQRKQTLKTQTKTDISTRAISTSALTNSVFFFSVIL